MRPRLEIIPWLFLFCLLGLFSLGSGFGFVGLVRFDFNVCGGHAVLDGNFRADLDVAADLRASVTGDLPFFARFIFNSDGGVCDFEDWSGDLVGLGLRRSGGRRREKQ